MLKDAKKKAAKPREAAPYENEKFVEQCALDLSVAVTSMDNRASSPEYHSQAPAQSSKESRGCSEEQSLTYASSSESVIEDELDI